MPKDRQPEIVEGAPGIDEAWFRRWSRGKLLMVAYLAVGILLVAVGSASGFGPFAWIASAQAMLLGVASPILSAIFAYGVLSIPIIWVLRQRVGAASPLLLGAQHAFDPTRQPRFVPSLVHQLAELRVARAWSLAAMGVAVLGGAAGAALSQRPGPEDGRPLPVLTHAQAVVRPDPLPRFVRLTEVTDQPSAAWTYDRHVRQTAYRDVYVPLTAPGWRTGDPVDTLELDTLLPDASPSRSNVFDPPGPREGALTRGQLEPWRAEAMHRAGLRLVPRPLVLERQPLDGVTPGPSWVTGFVWLDFAVAFAFVSALLAWRFSRQIGQLQPSATKAVSGLARPHAKTSSHRRS